MPKASRLEAPDVYKQQFSAKHITCGGFSLHMQIHMHDLSFCDLSRADDNRGDGDDDNLNLNHTNDGDGSPRNRGKPVREWCSHSLAAMCIFFFS
jgi:hypothetical protein